MSRSFLWKYLQNMVQYLKLSHLRDVIEKKTFRCVLSWLAERFEKLVNTSYCLQMHILSDVFSSRAKKSRDDSGDSEFWDEAAYARAITPSAYLRQSAGVNEMYNAVVQQQPEKEKICSSLRMINKAP